MRSRRSPVLFVIVGLLIAIAASAVTALIVEAGGFAGSSRALAAVGPNPDPNTVTVIGEGRQQAAPDQASLTLGVATTRGNVRDAMNAANNDMNKLVTSLRNQGVADQDMQTSTIAVNQESNCCPKFVTGYTASNSVGVTIHHLANVGSVIAAAIDAVGNDIQLNGVSLTLSNDSAQLKSARAAAMKAAQARAEEWASLSNRHLGKILSVSEVVGAQPQNGCGSGGGCGGGGGVPIEAGQTTVDVTVTVVYQLND